MNLRLARILIASLFLGFFLTPASPSYASVDNTFKNGAGEAFLKGTYVEVGVGLNGHFGTSNGVPSGKGLHPKGRTNIGFVGDRLRDGTWVDGDFFLPGSPYEGWYVDAAGTTGKFDNSNNSGATGAQTISDVNVTASDMSVVHTSVVNGLLIEQTYSVPIGSGTFVGDQELNISVKITNTTGSALAGIYYGRSVDPDNLKDQGGSYNTYNKIESQYGVGGNSYTLVSATASDSRQSPPGTSYLGLFSADSRSKVSRYTSGFSAPATASILYNGTGMINSATDAGANGDAGIALGFNIGTLAAGANTTFTFAYVLSATSAASAVAAASTPSYPPVTSAVGGNQSAVVSWTVPTAADTITGYTVRYAAGSPTAAATTLSYAGDTSTSHTVTGLTNGTTYYFAAAAITTDSSGTQTVGTWSDTTTATPIGVPRSFSVTGTSYSGETATISFVDAVSASPTDPITNYEYSLDSGTTWVALSPADTHTPISIPGILAGHSYPGQLRAINVNGAGPAVSLGTLYGPPVWSDTATANATFGSSYSDAVGAGLAATYSVVPSTALTDLGLTIDSSTGSFSGSPTSVGSFTITYRATNPNRYIETSIAITIAVDPSAPTWTGSSLPGMTTGNAVTIPTLSSGATLAFVLVGILPAGLALDTTTGQISGTPTAAGPYDFTVIARNSSGGNPQRFTGTISAPASAPDPVQTSSVTAISPSSGPADTLITITGSFLTPIVRINFGSGSISTWGQSSGAITFRAPAGFSGANSIQLFNGQSPALRALQFTYTAAQPVTPAATVDTSTVTTPLNKVDTTTPVAPVMNLDPQQKPYSQAIAATTTAITVNGVATTATVLPNASQTGIVVSSSGWQVSLVGKTADGTPSTIDTQGRIVLSSAHNVGISGDGFKPLTEVNVYIFSDAQLIGKVKTDANGSFVGTLPLPSSLDLGDHVIQLNGFSPSNDVRSASLPAVLVTSDAINAAGGKVASSLGNRIVIPYDFAKFNNGTTQLQLISQIAFKKGYVIHLTGYAQPTSGEDDIRISLDRALTVKKVLEKKYPSAKFVALGGGVRKNPLCTQYNNKCVVISYQRN